MTHIAYLYSCWEELLKEQPILFACTAAGMGSLNCASVALVLAAGKVLFASVKLQVRL